MRTPARSIRLEAKPRELEYIQVIDPFYSSVRMVNNTRIDSFFINGLGCFPDGLCKKLLIVFLIVPIIGQGRQLGMQACQNTMVVCHPTPKALGCLPKEIDIPIGIIIMQT